MSGFHQLTENGGLYFTADNIPAWHRFGTRTGTIDRAVLMRQTHSANIYRAKKEDIGRFIDDCDALITTEKDVPIAAKTADCVPVLLYSPDPEIAAAIHAGWRGTVARITQKCVSEMRTLGAAPGEVRAAIGPAIRFCCFEVREDFRLAVANALGEDICREFVRDTDEAGNAYPEGVYHADLIGLNVRLLRECGVKDIAVSDRCTCCETDIFHSWRGTGKKDSERTAIML